MILYIIRFSLSLSVIFLFYKMILEKEKSHQFKRWYLLSGLFLSLTAPFLSLNLAGKAKEIILNATPYIPTNYYNWEATVTVLYFVIVLILGVRLVLDIRSLLNKPGERKKIQNGRFTIILTKEKIPPHSFFHLIYFNQEDFKQIQEEILNHELEHARQWHSLDILFIELVKIFFWINPMISWYKSSIQLNHEFLADQHVIENLDSHKPYQNILFNSIHENVSTSSITSPLNFSLTKKRFNMMSKQKSNFQLIKNIIAIPVLSLILIACSDTGGVSGKDMLLYWRYTANMEEILKTGQMNEEDLEEGIILPISSKEEYQQLKNIYQKMNKTQKKSVYKLPAYLEQVYNDQ